MKKIISILKKYSVFTLFLILLILVSLTRIHNDYKEKKEYEPIFKQDKNFKDTYINKSKDMIKDSGVNFKYEVVFKRSENISRVYLKASPKTIFDETVKNYIKGSSESLDLMLEKTNSKTDSFFYNNKCTNANDCYIVHSITTYTKNGIPNTENIFNSESKEFTTEIVEITE